MAAKTMPISVPSEKPLKVVKWKVKPGAFVSHGQILFLYSDLSGNNNELKRFKAVRAGTISSIKVKEGDIAEPGGCVADLEECRHPTVMKEMCAECGADLRTDETRSQDVAVVPMIHSVPELKVSEELAQKLGKEDSERLLKSKKLVLLVDLDQTLVHTTNDDIPPNLKGVLHFFLRGPGNTGRWCHTRLRPHTQEFLESASKNYELHVCTFGARQYAHAVTELLDPEKKYFSHRILSRDECFDARTKSANLKALFPCGDNMVCIIDDREDVWRHAANLIQVRPYSFFQSTGDINAPPLLPEEKPPINLKNGSQIPANNQMPTLDPEPDQKEKKQNDITEQKNTKPSEGDNGKVISNDSKGKVDLKPESKEKVDSKPDSKEKVDSKPDSKEKVDSKPDSKEKFDSKADSKEKFDSKPDSNEKVDSKPDSKEKVDYKPDSKEKVDSKPDSKEKVDSKPDSNEKVVSKPNCKEKVNTKPDNDTEKPIEEEQDNKATETAPEPRWVETSDGQIEVEDSDDYLLYLDDILKRIHKHFYELYDSTGGQQVPDLKRVIPAVRRRVLAGTSLVFSGLVPTHQRLETSRAFLLARGLGADVTADLSDTTTHLVAVRSGTAKVNSARRLSERGRLRVVAAGWLWASAERWRRVDERLYPLQRAASSSSRRPPAHCNSPPPAPPPAAPRRRTPSGRFMDTLNPLLSFSSDDIADMDREVEDIFNESDESSSDSEKGAKDDDLDDEENPPEDRLISAETEDSQERLHYRQDAENSSDSEKENTERPRKRPRPSTPPSDDDIPPDDDDSSWNLMGAALERELEQD